MRQGHAEAQKLFEVLGRAQGYLYRRTWTKQLPTDGVWLAPTPLLGLEVVPLAALEVANSESLKVIKGSLIILAEVSPALGILVIQDVDIRRRLIRDGKSVEYVDQYLEKKFAEVRELARKFPQRIDVWSFAQLAMRSQMVAKAKLLDI